MEKYIGTKVVEAKKMTRGEYNYYKGWETPENENTDDLGYLIKYLDGYESWSPKKQFDDAYRRCDKMTFGLALEALKKGEYIARTGWNGKGMYLFLAHGEDIQKCVGIPDKCVDVVCMKTAQNTVVFGWLASQSDMLAEDWEIVE